MKASDYLRLPFIQNGAWLGCLVAVLSLVSCTQRDVITNPNNHQGPLGPVTPMLAGGDGHSLALDSNGTVWSWGANGSGQLGRGVPVNLPTPDVVTVLKGIRAVAADRGYSLAVDTHGTVWSWGENRYGQLGDGTKENRFRPVPVKGLDRATAIAAGNPINVGLRTDGSVWTWGEYSTISLMTGVRRVPTGSNQVKGIQDIAQISARSGYVAAAMQDGSLWAWGSQEFGHTEIFRPQPVKFDEPSNVASVAVGGHHAIALTRDGMIWTWGENKVSQLGDGTNTTSHRPVRVAGVDNVVAIAAGYLHTVALRRDGTVWTWGWNDSGQLGEPLSLTDRNTPGLVAGLTDVVAIAAGTTHSLAVKRDGTIWAWGSNRSGQLGDGTTSDRVTPVQVRGLKLTIPSESSVN